MIKVKKGLNVPIVGSPTEDLDTLKNVRSVAIIGSDYHGMRPTMLVEEGDTVKLGQALFEDKKNPGVIFTSPGAGKIESINRGPRRALQSVVIELGEEVSVKFNKYEENQLKTIPSSEIRKNLISSGLWTAFRTRPFSKIPAINSNPSNIFITAIDTNPLGPNVNKIIEMNESLFNSGLKVIKALTEQPVHLCVDPNFSLDLEKDSQLINHIFSGPHPAGLAGTHMHFISPATLKNVNWTINYQDVIAFGELFLTGELPIDKIVSLAGPQVTNPRLIKTRIGACTDELCAGELTQRDNRVISGSIINGREAVGPFAYLGRYHNQISVVSETNKSDRQFMNWLNPGPRRFSKIPLFISSLFSDKEFKFKTLMNGSDRAIVPIGIYEEVVPLNILPTILLRYIAVGETEKIQSLGGLELDEEDLALCSFVCPSKYDFGSLLRNNLTQIEVEG
jgi:Na+-transporting NADH:ubiquinone oxidoreductase subunit A|tara:strand:+ start:3413 stop:4762 length:1350 start_codon:yes stop_codon:yes gene_type:complete